MQEIDLDNSVYLLLYQSETRRGMDYNKHKVLIQKVIPACITQGTLTLLTGDTSLMYLKINTSQALV